jgi:hypothetical protein
MLETLIHRNLLYDLMYTSFSFGGGERCLDTGYFW